jgi:hypothetical protein
VAYVRRTDRLSAARSDLLFVLAAAVAGVVLAFPTAWLWLLVADPPTGELTKSGVILGELQLNQQSGVTLWFLAIGFLVGLPTGAAVGWLGRRRGLAVVVAVVALSAVATGLTAFLGIHVFGPDQQAEAAAASPGDSITSRVTVGADPAYLGWPIGALSGTCLALLGWSRLDKRVPPPLLAAEGSAPPAARSTNARRPVN